MTADAHGQRARFDILNATLLPQLPALVKQWLPTGRAAGAEWTALNPRRHDRRPGSFRVNLRSGRWADFATGEGGGDPVSLYAYLYTGGRQGAAARALDGGRIAVRQVGAAKVAKAANPEKDEARRIARARAIYAAAHSIGGAAEAYLIRRGLRPELAWTRLRTAVLRYPDAGEHPAIVAPVLGTSGHLEGIQRTFLTADGRKLPVRDPKLSLGRVHADWGKPLVGISHVYQRGPNSIRTKAKARAAIDVLEEHGWLHPVTDGAEIDGKRHRDAWRIVPPLSQVSQL